MNSYPVTYTSLHFRADPDKQEKDGNTPVHLAAAHGNLSSLKALLEAGASIWAFNDNRENPSQIAIKYNKGECFRFLDTLSVRMELTNKYLVDKLKTRYLPTYYILLLYYSTWKAHWGGAFHILYSGI